MSLLQRFRDIVGAEPPLLDAVGTISEKPRLIASDGDAPPMLTFRIDTRPELEFCRVVSPLAAERRAGDRVRVHYRLQSDNVAWVEWIESV